MDRDIECLLHEKQLYIAEEVNKLCRKHDLLCLLVGGSLLGAIKEQTIIRGDKDIDFGMLRDEYEAFLTFADELPDDLELLEVKRVDTYDWLFAKVCLKKSKLIRRDSINGRTDETGIYVDICPYDYVHNNRLLRRTEYSIAKIRKHLLRAKCMTWKTAKNNTLSFLLYITSRFVPRKALQKGSFSCAKSGKIVQNMVGGKATDWFYVDEIHNQTSGRLNGRCFSVPSAERYLQLNYPGWQKKELVRDDLDHYIVRFDE